jgi:hypothetical protein
VYAVLAREFHSGPSRIQFFKDRDDLRFRVAPECVNDFDTTGVRIIYAATSGRLM